MEPHLPHIDPRNHAEEIANARWERELERLSDEGLHLLSGEIEAMMRDLEKCKRTDFWLRCILAISIPAAALAAAILISLPAHSAEPTAPANTHQWANGASYMTIRPSDKPGAVAEVEFANAAVHTDAVEAFDLSLGGFTVSVEAIVGHGMTPDDMTVTPPEGYIAVPPRVSVPEGESRTITIYTHNGVGM